MKKRSAGMTKFLEIIQSLSRKKPFIITAAIGMTLGQLSYQVIISKVKEQPSIYVLESQRDQEVQDLKQQVIDAEKICVGSLKK